MTTFETHLDLCREARESRECVMCGRVFHLSELVDGHCPQCDRIDGSAA
ncbi:hypothetical protein [Xylanimonas ulmi]|uniref:Uncharacterized protein n=1 Tax=Xylanimonas ulmi TaxID=228973 RepID=A0A4Q7M4V4_9MICO|nr:hypothetical protein [Xylanibacterium ulmi]RZS61662.1 hypothetical protein EV386_1972 [Xylanibacterium ulmi]